MLPNPVSRRAALATIGTSFLSRLGSGQDSTSLSISAVSINQTKLWVTDLKKSLKWYQHVFGMPIVWQGKTKAVLQLGDGPQHLCMEQSKDQKPGIALIGLGVDQFEHAKLTTKLTALDIMPAEPSGLPQELSIKDPDGIEIRLSDQTLRGHNGTEALTTSPKKGILTIEDFNHFTTFASDSVRSEAFYRRVFRFSIDTYQGSMPLLRVGKGNQFLAFVGAGGRREFHPYIHHVCFTTASFDPDKILKSLEVIGVKQRSNAREPLKPLQSYVTLRMPNRGGALEGTPELYFTDPDGILLQIQDSKYSGGSGYLGDVRGK